MIGIAIIAVFIWLFGAQLWHSAWSTFRSNMLPIAIATITATILGGLVLAGTRDAYPAITTWLITGALVGFTAMAPVHSYYVPKQVAEATEEQAADALDFRQRTPYDVAHAVSNRNLGDTTGDATGGVKAIPTENDHGVYTTSVIRRGMFQGYESTQTNEPPLYGSTSSQNVKFCHFNDNAKLRMGGKVPSNNLKRAIQWRTSPSVIINRSDVVVHCENDVPMVYVPTTQLSDNFFMPYRVPGPVAVYNGHTGELAIHDDLDSELPLYPQSLATKQREALKATGSFWDSFFKRAGYEDTSKDEEDPNGKNRAEFTMADSNGEHSYYVTPLTTRGSSSSIVALGTIPANGPQHKGELRPYTINKYDQGESRQANSAIASRITGEVLSGYRASGLKVFEVVPANDDTWVATVGKEQSVLYRAIIHPNGNIDLLDSDGKQVAGEGEAPDSSDPISTDKPIESMTPEELEQLGNQILEELAKRAGQD